jgi:peptidoglycan/LPS O-acetylase OafA/YrhL
MFGLGLPELLILLILGGGTVLWAWMIIEAATRETGQDRLVWVIIIVFTHIIGAAIYYFVRRPVRKAALGR